MKPKTEAYYRKVPHTAPNHFLWICFQSYLKSSGEGSYFCEHLVFCVLTHSF